MGGKWQYGILRCAEALEVAVLSRGSGMQVCVHTRLVTGSCHVVSQTPGEPS